MKDNKLFGVAAVIAAIALLIFALKQPGQITQPMTTPDISVLTNENVTKIPEEVELTPSPSNGYQVTFNIDIVDESEELIPDSSMVIKIVTTEGERSFTAEGPIVEFVANDGDVVLWKAEAPGYEAPEEWMESRVHLTERDGEVAGQVTLKRSNNSEV